MPVRCTLFFIIESPYKDDATPLLFKFIKGALAPESLPNQFY